MVLIGQFDQNAFNELNTALSKKYKVYYQFNKDDSDRFNSGLVNEMNNEFDGGTVLLKISRNKQTSQTNLLLIYRDASLVEKKIKQKLEDQL